MSRAVMGSCRVGSARIEGSLFESAALASNYRRSPFAPAI